MCVGDACSVDMPGQGSREMIPLSNVLAGGPIVSLTVAIAFLVEEFELVRRDACPYESTCKRYRRIRPVLQYNAPNHLFWVQILRRQNLTDAVKSGG